jgi:hypothetical protein
MTVNARIRAVDYNTIRNQVNLVLGNGVGNTGYGQTSLVTSSTVAEGNRVSVSEWNRLKADISTCYRHIFNTNPPSITDAVVNQTIRSNATTSPYTQYQTFANDITNNRFQTPPNNIVTAKGSTSQVWPGIFGQYWRSTLQSTVTVSWPTANDARHFFNSGGELRFSSSRSGGTTSGGAGTIAAQNNEWTNFLTNTVQTRAFGGNKPVTGTGSLTGTNFYRLANTYTNPWYTATAGGAYSLNTFRIWARAVDIANNSSGGATTIEFLVEWIDDHIGTSGGPDGVDGTLTLNVSELRAAGEFTIETANVNIGRIEPAGAPANSTFTISPNFATINENQTVTFTVNTTNVSSGTQLYWTLAGGPGFTAADFSDGAGSGSLLINNNTGSLTRQLAPDYITEGSEFFVIELRINSISGQIVATSPSVAVNDTTVTQRISLTSNITSTSTLRSLAVARGWDQTSRLEFTVDPGFYILGTNNILYNRTESPLKHRDVAGLVIEGSFPNGLIIINKGAIVGHGGTGGAGGIGGNGSPGFAGGPGIVFTTSYSSTFCQVWNYGLIAGGGGGGGGGGFASGVNNGGGGGGGAPNGAGGTGGVNGAAASFYSSGDGGDVDSGYSKGGRGGNMGADGNTGSGNRPTRTESSGGSGGLGGYSVVGETNISYIVPGTRNGASLLSNGNN